MNKPTMLLLAGLFALAVALPFEPPNESLLIHNDVVYDAQGNVIAENTIDAVSPDSLYWKAYNGTNFMRSPKTTSPAPANRTAMAFQSAQNVVCMDPTGDYVYNVNSNILRKFSTVNGTYTQYTLAYASLGVCGTDGNYLFVPNGTSVRKYTLTGGYVNTTTINVSAGQFAFAVCNDTVWVGSGATYYGYGCNQFNGSSISHSKTWTTGLLNTPMNIAFDGTYYYGVSGGASPADFRRYYHNRTLYTDGAVSLDCRGVMCRHIKHNVGVTRIRAPSGTLDSGTTVTPACTVYNYGTIAETYYVRMRIGTGYNASVLVSNHAVAGRVYVTFPAWSAAPVGNLAVTCSTELTGDIGPANDKASGTVTVNCHNVGVTLLPAPTGALDSGTTITPACSVGNFGNVAETYYVRMRIGAGYNQSVAVNSQAAGTRQYVTFPAWLALARGTHVVTCSTELAGDLVPGNDKRTGTVAVDVRDVEVTSLIAPIGAVDSGTTVTPRASVRNNGTAAATFPVVFSITDGYSNTQTVTSLAPGATQTVSFTDWTPQARGSFVVLCDAQLPADMVPGNDARGTAVAVQVHNVGVVSIDSPATQVPPGAVTPAVTLRNAGTNREGCVVSFTIDATPPYSRTVNLGGGLPVGVDTSIQFTGWTAVPGNYHARCSLYLASEQLWADNVRSKSFQAGDVDIGAVAIPYPVGDIDSTVVIAPRAVVGNYGDLPATFNVYFRIDSVGGNVYNQSITVTGLLPDSSTTAILPTWVKPHLPGTYTTRCSVWIVEDDHPVNDVATGSFRITFVPPETGWVRQADVPLGPKNKKVKDGAALTYLEIEDTNYIYAFKGNNRYEFYGFNTETNTWVTKESIPAIGRAGKKKAVKKGSGLVTAEVQHVAPRLFGAKGNNTLEFWQYTPETTEAYAWSQVADVPAGTRSLKEGTGMALVKVRHNPGEDTTFVYLLKGSGTTEFYRYSLTGGAWTSVLGAPLGLSGKPYKNGSGIAWDSDRKVIYALKGSYNEFHAYSVDSNTWTTKAPLPLVGRLGKKKKVKDGAGLVYHEDRIYALKGGNTLEFWSYECDSDRWVQLNDLPLGSGKNVKGGGALTYGKKPLSALYALKGNNTLDFFKYTLSADDSRLTAHGPEIQTSSSLRTPHSAIRIAPNPSSFRNPQSAIRIDFSLPSSGNTSLKLYDITGKLVSTLAEGYRPAGSSSFTIHRSSLASGIYILKLNTEASSTTAKLVIE